MTLRVWTDGACSGAPGIGGWAWLTEDGRSGSGHEPSTTNQRMEMRAAVEALRAFPDQRLEIYSDSAYVVNCFADKWWHGWMEREWKNSQRKPVANRDLWEELIVLVVESGSTFVKVKGHAGDVMNERVDELAVAAKFSVPPERSFNPQEVPPTRI